MKTKSIKILLAFLMIGASTTKPVFSQSTIYIDHFKKGADVAESMYGIFFEEISHSGDGGLYAELIQNRGFEEHVIPSGCTLRDGRVYAPVKPNYVGGGYSNWNIAWDTEALKYKAWETKATNCMLIKEIVQNDPLHSATPHSLELRISDLTENGSMELINTGYWGIPVRSGEKYDLRFYLRSTDYNGKVTAKMTDMGGNVVFASQEFNVNRSGEWTEYTAELTASRTSYNGRFRLQFNSEGTVWVDYVSLFPQNTFKGRKNGLRKDVAEFLADLKPAFIRWPGGCIVEGVTLENRVKWKETIGDPMTRRGEWDLWGYRTTMGFGYHEFLQYCEDIGAEGMFVGNVGLSCRLRNGDYATQAEYPEFIKDIRDAIEYAIGDVSSEWGAKRAAAGHPTPFPLKYVELGNENWGPNYVLAYEAFYKELKKDYPQITFISTLGTDMDIALPEGTEMVDPHFYRNAEWFYNNTTFFDEITRGNYDVYVGEYACNQGVGSGNMNAALSEAAFMAGMERNSDLVKLTSYAPLIENNNKRDWTTNMIWLNNEKVMGRSSYYVQKMFGTNRPDYNVETFFAPDERTPSVIGRFGVGSWKTSVRYKDVKVTKNDGSKTFYQADFVDKKSDWVPFSGSWSFENGEYKQTEIANRCISMMDEWIFNDCIIEMKALKQSGSEGFIIVFGAPTDNLDLHYQMNIGGWSNASAAFEKVTNGTGATISEKVNFNIENNKWYDIKLVIKDGNKMDCYINGKYIIGCAINSAGKIQAVSGYDKAAGETVIKVVNAESTSLDADILLNATGIQSIGEVITLSATGPTMENTLGNPKQISPISTQYDGFSSNFNYSFKPYSFTILRIKSDEGATSGLNIPLKEYYSDEPTPVRPSSVTKVKENSGISFRDSGKNNWMISHSSDILHSIHIFDLKGMLLKSYSEINSNTCSIDLNELSDNVYLIEVITDNRQKDTIKIIKK